MKTNDEIRNIVETAFNPLRCVAEIWDFDQKLRFRVFDPKDEVVLTFPNEVLRHLRDGDALRNVILAARARIEEKGFLLEPWNHK